MRIENSIRKIATGTVLVRSLGVAAVLFLNAVLGNMLGVKNFGAFSLILAVGTVVANVASFGGGQLLIRYIGEYRERNRVDLQLGLLLFALGGVAVITLAFYGLANAVRFVAGIEVSSIFLLACLSVAFSVSLSHYRRSLFQALKRPVSSVAPEEVMLPVLVMAILLMFGPFEHFSAIGIYSAVLLAIFLAYIPIGGSALQVSRAPLKMSFFTRYWLRTALPMMGIGALQMAMARTDLLLLGSMSDYSEVGVYAAASRTAIAISFVLGTVTVVVLPLLTEAYFAKRQESFHRLLRYAVLLSLAWAIPCTVAFYFFAEQIMGIFGPDFVAGASTLRILTIGQLANAATGPAGLVLIVTNREGTALKMIGAAAALNALLNLVAISYFGAEGAAAATSLSMVLLNVSLFVVAWRRGTRDVDLSSGRLT